MHQNLPYLQKKKFDFEKFLMNALVYIDIDQGKTTWGSFSINMANIEAFFWVILS